MEFDLTKPYCYYFNEICKIPHGSGQEKQLSDWLVAFARAHALPVIQDELWNVIIYTPASPGYETHPGVILQAHMDMVCEKTEGCSHDFLKDPLELYVEEDLLRAKGTTLGADDGMGCAYMLAVLADSSLSHPYLECCFTTQEEVGLVGAQALKPEYFKARRMINLDGAGEYKTYMSMGGGEQITLKRPINWEVNRMPAYGLEISGLLGGHSGGMIDRERANAGKLAARILSCFLQNGMKLRLVKLQGGTKHNVIMNRAQAVFTTDADEGRLKELAAACEKLLREEYELSDPELAVNVAGQEAEAYALQEEDSRDLIELIELLPFGLLARNTALSDNPPVTSVNIGILNIADKEAVIGVSARSALECAVEEVKNRVTLLGELFGASAEYSGYYPGWKYEAKSELREIMKTVFYDLYRKPLNCLTGHGGNECGVFKKMHPDMDIVTSGAIYGKIHSPEEFLDLASFDRSWILLTNLLKAL